MDFYINCIKNYFNFSGRIQRKEFWTFTLINLTVLILLIFFITQEDYFNTTDNFGFLVTLFSLFIIFIIIPQVSACVRRLHDTNRSGWWWFIRFVPIIGNLWLLILLIEDSHPGKNKWGDNPKGIGNDTAIDLIGKE
ncbi:Uncharacterized membrane protein YhaH, DUF805 family [Tenacibaculum sp. 190524A02b]|uniref:Uncharacterized membrane protein YhaH, DUF805 family n=1 Tax=Tenacibaculum vairaonense TaxID=3137860 RepID=A0ABP1FFN0_9FLAO